VGRFAHHRRESEERAAPGRNGRVGRDRARQRQGQSHGTSNKILGGEDARATNRGPALDADCSQASSFAAGLGAGSYAGHGIRYLGFDAIRSLGDGCIERPCAARDRSLLRALGASPLIQRNPYRAAARRIEAGCASRVWLMHRTSSAIVTGLPAGRPREKSRRKIAESSALVAAAVGKP